MAEYASSVHRTVVVSRSASLIFRRTSHLNCCRWRVDFAFIFIYRPDSASTFTVNDDDFFVDFADVLKRTATLTRCVTSTSNMDKCSSTELAQFNAHHNDSGLRDVVCELTHARSHQADIFVSRTNHGLSGHLMFLFCSTAGLVCMVC